MKKWIALLFALILAMPNAIAEDLPDNLTLEVTGMQLLSEWNGETSETHDWLAVTATATNWYSEAVSLSGKIAATLSYKDRYTFPAELAFSEDSLEPLVQLDGALIFRIPKMVSEALDEAQLTIDADGMQISPEISVSPARQASFNGSFEREGFATPEEAVQAYVEAFNRGDVLGMLSTFAIETYVDHVDQQAYLDAMKSFSPASHNAYPIFSDLSRNLLVAVRCGDLAQDLCYQYLTYAMPTEFGPFDMRSITFLGDDSAEKIQSFLDGFKQASYNSWVGNIAFNGFMDLSQLSATQYENYNNETTQKNLEKYMARYGCDELVDLLAQIQIQGEDYVQFMQCARYGDLWYNLRFGGTFADLLGLNNFLAGLVLLSPFTE